MSKISLGLSRRKHEFFITTALLQNYSYESSRKLISDLLAKEIRLNQDINYLSASLAEHFQVVLVFLSRIYRVDFESSKGARSEKLIQDFNKDLDNYFNSLRKLSEA